MLTKITDTIYKQVVPLPNNPLREINAYLIDVYKRQRLDSHMIQLKNILSGSEGPVGKKLDFLVQEMNREANTIGSKANDMEITSLMLETKSEIEKIREQVQNIE